MTGTSRNMTGERAGATGGVYTVYGTIDPEALTLSGVLAGGAVLRQVPLDALVNLESGVARWSQSARDGLAQPAGGPYAGAVGFDDWWTTALTLLNLDFPLVNARRLVIDKAALYRRLRAHGIAVPDFIVGPLGPDLLKQAVDALGPQPVLKPCTGAGSRGVYRMSGAMSVEDDLAVYRQLLALGHIDTSIPTMATAYLGGNPALEVSVDLLVAASAVVSATVQEKATATTGHPFTDRIMLSPPVRGSIVEHTDVLDSAVRAIPAAIGLDAGAAHVELRLHAGTWHVLDIGVRPGSGLVPHAVQARTGVDPRLVHLRAGIVWPVHADQIRQAAGNHAATAIACCYATPETRGTLTLTDQARLADTLASDPRVFGWHLNAAVTDDQVYAPDAGLSIGVGADDPHTALQVLRSLVEPFGFTTT